MTFEFGKRSEKELATCHPDLQRIARLALKHTNVDFGILHGYRGQQQQDRMFAEGASKLKYPDSKHNKSPSMAFDFAAYIGGNISWSENYYYYIAGILTAAAKQLNIKIRWGGDWDGDGDFKDQKFNDLGHIELL